MPQKLMDAFLILAAAASAVMTLLFAAAIVKYLFS